MGILHGAFFLGICHDGFNLREGLGHFIVNIIESRAVMDIAGATTASGT
jgi:hypothetical protein